MSWGCVTFIQEVGSLKAEPPLGVSDLLFYNLHRHTSSLFNRITSFLWQKAWVSWVSLCVCTIIVLDCLSRWKLEVLHISNKIHITQLSLKDQKHLFKKKSKISATANGRGLCAFSADFLNCKGLFSLITYATCVFVSLLWLSLSVF